MIDRIIEKFKSEPVRVRLYSLLLVIGTYLLVKGHVQASDLEFIATVAALVLGVERSRANVTPTQV